MVGAVGHAPSKGIRRRMDFPVAVMWAVVLQMWIKAFGLFPGEGN